MFRRDQIFISYAREDVKWEEKFSANLHATLRHQTSFSVWSDERIRTGDDWRREISQALDRARVALLLVSTAFQNSRFIRDVEFPRLLKDAEDGGVTVYWVPVSPCSRDAKLGSLQAAGGLSWDLTLQELKPASKRERTIVRICEDIASRFGFSDVSPERKGSVRMRVERRVAGKYRVVDEIASGKYTIVYRAERENLGQVVGIKAFIASELEDWAVHAFEEGVRQSFAVQHPAFIRPIEDFPIEDVSEGHEGAPYLLVSDFVEAERLDEYLGRRGAGISPTKIKSILVDLAEALADEHRLGRVHGEICPSDVLIDELGHAKLSPLNFSNVIREEAQSHGNFLVDRESLAFMTPERFEGKEHTMLTDQYSLGLIAAELLGFRLPEVGSPRDLTEKPALYEALNRGDGGWSEPFPELGGVVRTMLKIEPEERLSSMEEVVRELQEVKPPLSPAERTRKLVRRSYRQLIGCGALDEETFYKRFYRNLFTKAPEVEAFFKDVDWDRQKKAIYRALKMLIDFRPEEAEDVKLIRAYAKSHAEYRLEERHYDAFLQAMIDTLREIGESEGRMLDAWEETLSAGLEVMQSFSRNLNDPSHRLETA